MTRPAVVFLALCATTTHVIAQGTAAPSDSVRLQGSWVPQLKRDPLGCPALTWNCETL